MEKMSLMTDFCWRREPAQSDPQSMAWTHRGSIIAGPWMMHTGCSGKSRPGDRVVLLGAGFIGCIVLQALVEMKLDLTVVELADRMLARMMDDPGGNMIKHWCENQGIKVRTGTAANSVADKDNVLEN